MTRRDLGTLTLSSHRSASARDDEPRLLAPAGCERCARGARGPPPGASAFEQRRGIRASVRVPRHTHEATQPGREGLTPWSPSHAPAVLRGAARRASRTSSRGSSPVAPSPYLCPVSLSSKRHVHPAVPERGGDRLPKTCVDRGLAGRTLTHLCPRRRSAKRMAKGFAKGLRVRRARPAPTQSGMGRGSNWPITPYAGFMSSKRRVHHARGRDRFTGCTCLSTSITHRADVAAARQSAYASAPASDGPSAGTSPAGSTRHSPARRSEPSQHAKAASSATTEPGGFLGTRSTVHPHSPIPSWIRSQAQPCFAKPS